MIIDLFCVPTLQITSHILIDQEVYKIHCNVCENSFYICDHNEEIKCQCGETGKLKDLIDYFCHENDIL